LLPGSELPEVRSGAPVALALFVVVDVDEVGVEVVDVEEVVVEAVTVVVTISYDIASGYFSVLESSKN